MLRGLWLIRVFILKARPGVTDAIKAAGNDCSDADAKSVNLAASLSDEEVIYVATMMKNLLFRTGQVSTKEGKLKC